MRIIRLTSRLLGSIRRVYASANRSRGLGRILATVNRDAMGRVDATVNPAEVAAMFDRIAPVYDAMNAFISGFQEPRWRRRAVAASRLQPGMTALDVATGTGKVAAALAERVGPTGHVTGVDLAPKMIERARLQDRGRHPWLRYTVGDALALPIDDASVDSATIAFGMRNLPDHARGFAELRRVVRPGGTVVCLEIARPSGVAGRLGRAWFERAVPALGALIGQADAYRYLVTSVRAYPPPGQVAAIMRDAGLVGVGWTRLTAGMVTIHVGRRAERSET
jgi:demethylmenaquinone methyltransferase/2-methoxy-6-polyprenyl-1,4-benzoquinol methylase